MIGYINTLNSMCFGKIHGLDTKMFNELDKIPEFHFKLLRSEQNSANNESESTIDFLLGVHKPSTVANDLNVEKLRRFVRVYCSSLKIGKQIVDKAIQNPNINLFIAATKFAAHANFENISQEDCKQTVFETMQAFKGSNTETNVR